jgi:hypothetical protein
MCPLSEDSSSSSTSSSSVLSLFSSSQLRVNFIGIKRSVSSRNFWFTGELDKAHTIRLPLLKCLRTALNDEEFAKLEHKQNDTGTLLVWEKGDQGELCWFTMEQAIGNLEDGVVTIDFIAGLPLVEGTGDLIEEKSPPTGRSGADARIMAGMEQQ